MAVTLQATQSGSGSTSLHLQSGDTVTFVLASIVKNDVLANALVNLDGLTQITGVNFVASIAGNAS